MACPVITQRIWPAAQHEGFDPRVTDMSFDFGALERLWLTSIEEALLSSEDKTVKLWDTATAALIRTFDDWPWWRRCSRATIRDRARRPPANQNRTMPSRACPGGTP